MSRGSTTLIHQDVITSKLTFNHAICGMMSAVSLVSGNDRE